MSSTIFKTKVVNNTAKILQMGYSGGSHTHITVAASDSLFTCLTIMDLLPLAAQ